MRFVILLFHHGNVPTKFRFCEEKAPEGLLLYWHLVASVFDLPTSEAQFSQKLLRINSNDMTCVYSTDDGLSFKNTVGLTLKSSVLSNKRNYSSHFKASESAVKKFRGVKVSCR